MNEKFWEKFQMFVLEKFQMFVLIASIGGVNFKIFHRKCHTQKNNNQIATNENFKPLYLGNPL